MKFTILTPALCALAAAAPINVEAPVNADVKNVNGAVDTATGATQDLTGSHINGGLRPAKQLVDNAKDVKGRDFDFDSDFVELDTPISVGEGLVDRDDDTTADAGIVELHAPIEILPGSDKRDGEGDGNPLADVDIPIELTTDAENLETREVELPIDAVSKAEDTAPVNVNVDADVDVPKPHGGLEARQDTDIEMDRDVQLEEAKMDTSAPVDFDSEAIDAGVDAGAGLV